MASANPQASLQSSKGTGVGGANVGLGGTAVSVAVGSSGVNVRVGRSAVAVSVGGTVVMVGGLAITVGESGCACESVGSDFWAQAFRKNMINNPED